METQGSSLDVVLRKLAAGDFGPDGDGFSEAVRALGPDVLVEVVMKLAFRARQSAALGRAVRDLGHEGFEGGDNLPAQMVKMAVELWAAFAALRCAIVHHASTSPAHHEAVVARVAEQIGDHISDKGMGAVLLAAELPECGTDDPLNGALQERVHAREEPFAAQAIEMRPASFEDLRAEAAAQFA